MSHLRCVALAVIVAAGTTPGCRAQPSSDAQAPSAFAADPPRTTGPVRLTGVTPDRLALSGDRIAPQTLLVSYAIDDPGTVTEATLELHHPDLFRLAKMDLPLPVSATGVVSFAAEPSAHALGPVVRFRVTCQGSATGWYVMGQIPHPVDAARGRTFEIHSVRPESIPAHKMPAAPDDPAVRAQVTTAEVIYVRAGQLTPACGLEAQVNGVGVTLGNVNVVEQNNAFQALLLLRDLDFTPVARRYVELKLTVTRAGGARHGAITRLALAES